MVTIDIIYMAIMIRYPRNKMSMHILGSDKTKRWAQRQKRRSNCLVSPSDHVNMATHRIMNQWLVGGWNFNPIYGTMTFPTESGYYMVIMVGIWLMMVIIWLISYLGKLQYFTHLNCWAIKGDDSPNPNHDFQ